MMKPLILAIATLTAVPAFAQHRFGLPLPPVLQRNMLPPAPPMELVDDQLRWAIKPSEAAMIAQRTVPGSVVLSVRPLPGGQYVVTLRAGNAVTRVMVNAMTGGVS